MSCHQLLVSKLLGGAAAISLEIAKALRESGDESRVWLPGQQTYRVSSLSSPSRLVALAASWMLCNRLRKHGARIVPFLYGSNPNISEAVAERAFKKVIADHGWRAYRAAVVAEYELLGRPGYARSHNEGRDTQHSQPALPPH